MCFARKKAGLRVSQFVAIVPNQCPVEFMSDNSLRSAPLLPVCGAVVSIEKLIPEGGGLGRLDDGRVVLVDAVTPGDRLEIEEASVGKSCVRVTRWKLLQGSRQRVTPRCKAWEQCGGCDWMMLDAQGQRQAKRALVEEALRRTGKFDLGQLEVLPCIQEAVDGYRSRVRLQIERGRLGFFARSSQRLVEPEHCWVASPVVNLAIAVVRTALAQLPDQAELFSSVEVRECSEGRVSLYFLERVARHSSPGKPWRGRAKHRSRSRKTVSPERRAEATRLLQSALSSQFTVVTEPEQARNELSWQRFAVTSSTTLMSPPGSFTQVHLSMNRRLLSLALQGAESREVRSFLDLYCGAGNFSLPLLAMGLSGMGVEGSELSIAAARRASELQGLGAPQQFVAGDVPAIVEELVRQSKTFDLVLIDPPRAGVASGLLEMLKLSSGWLLLCSCNPVTLARDLRILVDAGCTIESVQPLDLFPQTHHVETLVWLRVPPRAIAIRRQEPVAAD